MIGGEILLPHGVVSNAYPIVKKSWFCRFLPRRIEDEDFATESSGWVKCRLLWASQKVWVTESREEARTSLRTAQCVPTCRQSWVVDVSHRHTVLLWMVECVVFSLNHFEGSRMDGRLKAEPSETLFKEFGELV